MFKIIFGILFLYAGIYAQSKAVRGTITDAATGESLAAANLQIENTYHGTITNEQGVFRLEVESFPCTIIVTYVGYSIEKIRLDKLPEHFLNIKLKPVLLETEAIVVTAEDPAVGIMRKVIANKKKWYDRLNTYEVDAYARVNLANDTSLASVAESISEIYWDRERGQREIIKSKRQTKNIKENQVFAFGSHIPNFYDDDIEIQGYKIVGPTNPDAFDYYDFKLIDRKALGQDTVFVIRLIPTAKLNPTFVGTVSVLDSFFALINVDVKPNPQNIFFPMPIKEWNVYYKQQFSNFGKDFWLPVDMRASGDVKISMPGLEFPLIKYARSVRLTDYLVNLPLPDSLYKEKKGIRIDSAAVARDSLFQRRLDIIPLTKEEEVAYQEIDSTDTFEKAFKPSGFLASMVMSDSDEHGGTVGIGGKIFSFLSPDFAYNRVEEAHLGLGVHHTFFNRFDLHAGTFYSSGLKKWGYSAGMAWNFGNRALPKIHVDYQKGTASNYESENYFSLMTSIGTLLGAKDYYDYNWKSDFSATINLRIPFLRINAEGIIHVAKYESLDEKIFDYNLLGRKINPRPNPAIDDGNLRSLELHLNYGGDYIPFGLAGQYRADLNIEHSSPNLLSSDFDFTRYDLRFDWHFSTFLKRRLLPNALDIHIQAGTSDGQLPLQKLFALDAAYNSFAPFGVFHGLRALPYIGDKYAAIFWENNFRSVPFELIGLRWFAEKNIGIIVHGAHGRTWLSDKNKAMLNTFYHYTDGFHNEVGVSLNGLFSILRIDVTRRLDRAATYLNFSLARWF